ncbi:hypothetical protein LSAT2_023157 [Lamellibrachia satsuma]|nr:hypothetical protein LSAT2_023157 [Lamellibrachia satsuma]
MFKRRVTRLLFVMCVFAGTLSIYNVLVNNGSQRQAGVLYNHPDDSKPGETVLLKSKVGLLATRRRRQWRHLVPHKHASVMNAEEKQLIFDLVEKVAYVCMLRNITYFLYSGTLLGSYRHHDMIPWDDDIDVIVNQSQRAVLHSSLETLYPRYAVAYAGPRIKFYSLHSTSTSKYPWKWPYVDISFFYENATHVGDISPQFRHCVFPKSIIFPLHTRPLGNLYLNSPFDAYAALKIGFNNLHHCTTHSYSHKYEKSKQIETYSKLPCARLRYVVPFVHRRASSKGVRETLVMGESIIHTIVVDEPRYAVVTPFTLELL